MCTAKEDAENMNLLGKFVLIAIAYYEVLKINARKAGCQKRLKPIVSYRIGTVGAG